MSGSVSVLRFVSIHAPTWGATRAKGFAEVVENCFNPRAHVGRDDKGSISETADTASFNPRAHVGRDI